MTDHQELLVALTELAGEVKSIHTELSGEIKATREEAWRKLNDIHDEAVRTNGRVTRIERFQQDTEVLQARQDGREAGRDSATAYRNKRDLAILGAFVTLAVAAAEFIGRLVA